MTRNDDNPYAYSDATGRNYVGNLELRRRVIAGMTLDGEHFAIVGGRRCGKTSTLHTLKRQLEVMGDSARGRRVVPVMTEASAGPVSAGILFREILAQLTSGLDVVKAERLEAFGHMEEPYREFRRELKRERVRSALNKRYGRRWLCVIMMDEIDDIARRLREGGHQDVFLRNLRHLLMEEVELKGHFRLVATGVNEMYRLIRSGSPLNMMAKVELQVLNDDDVNELVDVGFAGAMEGAGKTRLVDLTGRHPYLVQGVLQHLWPPGRLGVDEGQVTRAANQFQGEHEGDFWNWLNRFDAITRMAYGFLSANGEESVRLSALVSAIDRGRGVIRGREIQRSLSTLITHGVAVGTDDGGFQVMGRMFLEWFQGHAPVQMDAITEVVDQWRRLVEQSGLSRKEKRRALDLLTRSREVVDSGGDPAEIRNKVGEALRRVWECVRFMKESAELVKMAFEIAPHLGMAGRWIIEECRL